MRKFKRPITEIIIKHKQEAVSIYFKTTQNLIRVENYTNTADPESRFILHNCNPTQIANELLEWCDEECLTYPCGSVNKRVLCIDEDHIRLEHQLRKDELYGFVRHSIPNFKQLLKVELEKYLEPEEELPNLGIYKVLWKSGGSSLAAIGMNRDGSRWFAPTNWVSPSSYNESREDIDFLVPLLRLVSPDSEPEEVEIPEHAREGMFHWSKKTTTYKAGKDVLERIENLEIESNKHSDAITLTARILKQAGVEK